MHIRTLNIMYVHVLTIRLLHVHSITFHEGLQELKQFFVKPYLKLIYSYDLMLNNQ